MRFESERHTVDWSVDPAALVPVPAAKRGVGAHGEDVCMGGTAAGVAHVARVVEAHCEARVARFVRRQEAPVEEDGRVVEDSLKVDERRAALCSPRLGEGKVLAVP